MQLNNLVLIAAAEVVAVLLIFCLILLFQNRKLRAAVKKLQNRMEQLVEDLKKARQGKSSLADTLATPAQQELLFSDHLGEQLNITKQYHAKLESDRDIVLDLSPDTELPRRAAALRYAMLMAEKEAWANVEDGHPRWEILKAKYEQIFSFYEDFVPESDGDSLEEIEALNQELLNAKKRINNLEKFKALYFDLEGKWEESKQTAQTHYNNLSEMADKVEDKDAFEFALDSYHAAYNDVSKLIETGIDNPNAQIESYDSGDDKSAGELRHLRSVAADQHRIITELQAQIKNAPTSEERNLIVDGLKEQLNKQQRFVQESETCIQLMEDELHNANKEVSQLKDRLKTLPSLKSQLQEAKSQSDQYELKVYALTSENRKLIKRLKEEKNSGSIDTGEASKLKKELTDLETRYASLEEKYLDLKMQQ